MAVSGKYYCLVDGQQETISKYIRNHIVWDDYDYWEELFYSKLESSLRKQFKLSLFEIAEKPVGKDHFKAMFVFASIFVSDMRSWGITKDEYVESLFLTIKERFVLEEKFLKVLDKKLKNLCEN